MFANGRTVDSPMPSFENRYETDHFVLKWTNRSSHSEDNIRDPQIIKDTAEYLERHGQNILELFGRKPYMAPGQDKIEVVFRDMDCYGVSDPPNGPIQFNSYAWVNNSGIRQPTSAHELFHKLQYAYGYKTEWKPRRTLPVVHRGHCGLVRGFRVGKGEPHLQGGHNIQRYQAGPLSGR